jgi:hypothetical protein
MKRALLLIVVPALLVALGFAQTPAASINTDQTIKGCLGGSDGNYTAVEDSTGHIFKITTNSVDFKQHLGHDVALIGHKTSGASSAAADNSFAVTELNMISEHCAAASAATIATASTPSETASTPPASAAVPVATTIATVADTAITPAAAATPPAETVVTPAAAAPPAETVVTPAAAAAPPAEIVVTPAATISTPSETVSTHAAPPRRRSETPAAATTPPDVTAGTPDAAATPPTAAANSSSEAASTPAAAATPPAATSRGWSVSFLIAFAVLVIVLGTMVPVFSRWRKRKLLERTGAQNLSFTREASSDQDKSEKPGPRKAA